MDVNYTFIHYWKNIITDDRYICEIFIMKSDKLDTEIKLVSTQQSALTCTTKIDK